jgi:hypothetical protein
MAYIAKSLPKCVESRKTADEEALLRALAQSVFVRADGILKTSPQSVGSYEMGLQRGDQESVLQRGYSYDQAVYVGAERSRALLTSVLHHGRLLLISS